MPSVSVIVVNRDGAALLPDCLGSLREQTYQDFEVILVDNGSSDDSVGVARQHLRGLRVIALSENAGFARANNLGLAAARGRYVVLLNNDTRAHPDFVRELVEAAEREPGIGMVAPKILNFADRQVIDSVGGLLLTPDGIGQGRGRGEIDQGQYDEPAETLVPSGCAALYRKAMLDEIGGLAEEFFAYCEDLDLGLRGVWAGWRTANAPRAVVWHKYSATTGRYAPTKLYLVERNHYWVAIRNFPGPWLAALPLWSLARWALMGYAAVAGRGRGKARGAAGMGPLLAAWWRGQLDALGLASKIWRSRTRLRRLSDREFRERVRPFRLPISKLIFTE
ncbi:MAG: glycosyltransferase family 2 protein [Gemmataceae bacterium]|nr:glycosyltransferase family 2 protein [Gemmataceae bacterium]MDW8266943.1 glycosyltransferase family 2 protein [Gemmataceae bacterium]